VASSCLTVRSWRLRGSGEVCPFGAPPPCSPQGDHDAGTLPHGVISDATLTSDIVPVHQMSPHASRWPLDVPGYDIDRSPRNRVTKKSEVKNAWSSLSRSADQPGLPAGGELIAGVSRPGLVLGALAGKRCELALDFAPHATQRNTEDALTALYQVDDLVR